MSLRSLIQLRGLIEGTVVGSRNIAPTDLQNSTPPEFEIQDVLDTDNLIPVPANAKGAIIIFDPTSTTTKRLKGTAGDTGIILAKNKWNVITFEDTPPVSFYIACSAIDTGKTTTVIFF